jgi:hypothetical protein
MSAAGSVRRYLVLARGILGEGTRMPRVLDEGGVEMAITKKGSRRIVVDGAGYRWYIRRTPSGLQHMGDSNLTVAVELEASVAVSVLVVDVGVPRPDSIQGGGGLRVCPSDVARFIRIAKEAGWQPGTAGGAFELTAETGV